MNEPHLQLTLLSRCGPQLESHLVLALIYYLFEDLIVKYSQYAMHKIVSYSCHIKLCQLIMQVTCTF